MTGIKRLVLDVLKPHQPSILELAKSIAALKHVTGVNLSLYEVDTQTENIKITVEGVNIDFDEVAAGMKLVEEVETLQDR
jgi:hypothetical protein